jgi:hypothetical protein
MRQLLAALAVVCLFACGSWMPAAAPDPPSSDSASSSPAPFAAVGPSPSCLNSPSVLLQVVIAPAATPIPTPTPILSPFPIILGFTTRATVYPQMFALARAAAATWNAALEREVFAFGSPSQVQLDLMDSVPAPGGGRVIGQVDSIEAPHWVGIWPGNFSHPEAETVFLHELGHVLGCRHTTDFRDVMYPVTDYVKELSVADIALARLLVEQRAAF